MQCVYLLHVTGHTYLNEIRYLGPPPYVCNGKDVTGGNPGELKTL